MTDEEGELAARSWSSGVGPDLARLHLELLLREEGRRATPLDPTALARELAELGD